MESDATCSQVRRQIWLSVRHYLGITCAVEQDAENLQIKIVDQNGNPVPVFRDFVPDHRDASYIPDLPNLKVIDILGNDCIHRVLFLTIEWSDRYALSNGEIIPIDENKFCAFIDDESVFESERKVISGVVTLEQCLEAFTSPERLDEQNTWYCSRCQKHVRAMKTIELWKLPNVLIIHLKRFDSKHVPYGLRREKLDTFVDLPIHGLDMSRHCAAYYEPFDNNRDEIPVYDKIPAEYDLFGVINHFGRLGFGHYTAFARRWNITGIEPEWALFDDSSVSRVADESSVVTPAAYVLFYRRRIFT